MPELTAVRMERMRKGRLEQKRRRQLRLDLQASTKSITEYLTPDKKEL